MVVVHETADSEVSLQLFISVFWGQFNEITCVMNRSVSLIQLLWWYDWDWDTGLLTSSLMKFAFIVVILGKIVDSGVVSSEFRILFWGEGV
jgi:hypothetical protein